VPLAAAAQRAAHRERADPGRTRDRYESDAGLQDRTAAVYRDLAAAGWLAPWTVLDGTAGADASDLDRDGIRQAPQRRRGAGHCGQHEDGRPRAHGARIA